MRRAQKRFGSRSSPRPTEPKIGPVIRQVVEPRMYTIRYLVVYDLERERHILLPSNTIVDITEDRVHSSLTKGDVAELPSFRQSVSRRL